MFPPAHGRILSSVAVDDVVTIVVGPGDVVVGLIDLYALASLVNFVVEKPPVDCPDALVTFWGQDGDEIDPMINWSQ